LRLVKNSHQSTLGLVLAFVLYVLSFGPAVAYCEKVNTPSRPAVMGIYRPFYWCCENNVEPVSDVIRVYVNFWFRLLGV